MKPKWMLLAVIVVALVLSACGGSQPAPAAGEPTREPAAPGQPQPPSGGSQPSGQSQPPAPAPTETLPEFADVTSGLDKLDSYESSFTMAFDGEEDGQPKQWQWIITEAFVKNPPAKRTIIDMTGGADQGQIQTIEVGGKQYSLFGDTCVSGAATEQPTAGSSMNPASIVGDIRAAQLLGSEIVNGVPTQHYVVNLDRYSTLGWTDARSEAWLATTGNYVVKSTFQGTGDGGLLGLGNGVKGKLTWTYELKSVNQPITIEAPANCGGAPSDVPMMSDATDESSFGPMTMYKSPTKLADVASFYQTQMKANGWTEKEGGMSAEGFQILTFTKDKRTANITLTVEGDMTAVTISIEGE